METRPDRGTSCATPAPLRVPMGLGTVARAALNGPSQPRASLDPPTRNHETIGSGKRQPGWSQNPAGSFVLVPKAGKNRRKVEQHRKEPERAKGRAPQEKPNCSSPGRQDSQCSGWGRGEARSGAKAPCGTKGPVLDWALCKTGEIRVPGSLLKITHQLPDCSVPRPP